VFTTNYGPEFSLTDADAPNNSGDLLPSSEAGTYSVSETLPAGWDQTSASCTGDGNTPGSITVLPGETVTCIFTNTQLAGLSVVKQTLGGDGSFNFTSAALGNFQITTVGNTGLQTFTNLEPGVFDLAEAALPAGWNLTSATCSNGDDPAAVTLGAGESVTCTFVNEEDPSLTLIKAVVGGTATPADFVLTLTGVDGQHDNGINYGSGVSPPVIAGVPYTLSEIPDQVPEYADNGVTCQDDDDLAPVAHPVTLSAGQNVTCRLTNVYQSLYVPVPVPANNPIALLMLILTLLATGWYLRPAALRKL
jgi:hypothetical protein